MSAPAVLASGLAWRWAGLPASGRALVRAATGPDMASRELAGMLLTRAGDRSVPLLATALSEGPDRTTAATILASIGSRAAREVLARASTSADPAVAGAARPALDVLDRIRGWGPYGPEPR
jgi:hypothetical protein